MVKEVPSEGLEYIYNMGELIAVILRDNFRSEKVVFLTPGNLSQQLGYHNRKKGEVIRAHKHIYNRREVYFTQETIFIKDGKVRVNFYDSYGKHIGSEVLGKGDIILLCGGGHGFDILEDTVMVEIKQGPYVGDEDKERF